MTTIDLKAPTAATVAFLRKLGCNDNFDSQSAASAKIEEILRTRDTSKAATEQQHKAINALGGRPIPGAIHREASRIIAVLGAIEVVDLATDDQEYVDALAKLLDVCREQFQRRPSMRVTQNAASSQSQE